MRTSTQVIVAGVVVVIGWALFLRGARAPLANSLAAPPGGNPDPAPTTPAPAGAFHNPRVVW